MSECEHVWQRTDPPGYFCRLCKTLAITDLAELRERAQEPHNRDLTALEAGNVQPPDLDDSTSDSEARR